MIPRSLRRGGALWCAWAFGLWVLACEAPPPKPKPKASSRPRGASHQEPHARASQAYLEALMKESMDGDLQGALQRHRRLLQRKDLSRRLRALSMYQSIRLLRSLGEGREASALARRLKKEHPRQLDLHPRGLDDRSGPHRPISLRFRALAYRQFLALMGKLGKVKIELRGASDKARRLSVRLRSVPWDEALRTVVWSMGDGLYPTAKGYEVRPRAQLSRPTSTVDLLRSEIPDKLRLIAEIGRKSGLSLSIRRGTLVLRHGGLGIYPTHARCRGSRQALLGFLGRVKLLPFPIQVQAHGVRQLSPGLVEARIFLGLKYISPSPTKRPRPTTAPASRPRSRPALQRQLTAPQIRAVIRSAKSGIQRCFERQLGALKKSSRVRVVLEAVIQPSGQLRSASLRGVPPKLAPMKSCILRWSKGLRFPAISGKATVLRYPFVFVYRPQRPW